jgi:hypothetical protein
MSRPKPRRAEGNAGAFLGPDILIPAPIRTLGDEYHDEPAEPEDSDRQPEPEPTSLVRRVLDRLGRATVGRPARSGPKNDPSRSHPFQETNDPGIVPAASAGGNYQGAQPNMLAVTTAALRGTRCAMAGCGKERRDPIHSPADD